MKSGCPRCAFDRNAEAKGFATDQFNLSSVNPDVAAEWHPRNQRSANTYLPKSGKRVWWRCRKDPEHEWQAVIASRTSLDGETLIGCPFCSGKRSSKRHNLLANAPSVAKLWHPQRNPKGPEHYTPSSHKKVWWLCEKGHEWEASIKNRTAGRGCPYCTHQSSSPEVRILTELRGAGFEVQSRSKVKSHELDIFIPELHTGIEYDGAYWHRGKLRKDVKKQRAIEAAGLRLIRVRELPLSKISGDDLITSPNIPFSKKEMDALLLKLAPNDKRVCHYLEKPAFVNDDLYRAYLDCFPSPFPENSLQHKNPGLAKEWHPTKNTPLSPLNFTGNSGHKAWWICENGHEWLASIDSRNRKKTPTGCPYCSPTFKRPSPDNNLALTHPYLVPFFHPTKNQDLLPDQITGGAIKEVWWRCPSDPSHEFKRSPNHMSSSKAVELCPYCAGTYVSSLNCMATTHPSLAVYFHPSKNNQHSAKNIRAGNKDKFWWRCPNNHEWQATPWAMARRKVFCKICGV